MRFFPGGNIERLLARSVGIILTILVIAFSLCDPIFLTELRFKSFDTLNRLHPAPIDIAPVIIVDIDSESLASLGQWPWPRTIIGDLFNKITAAGPAVVGLDMVFAEPDRSSPRNLAANAGLSNVPEEVQAYLKQLPDHDFELAKALYYSKAPIVIGHAFTNDDATGDGAIPKSGTFAFQGQDPTPFLFHFNRVDANLNMFEKTARGSGFFNILPDHDGIIRREPLLISHNDKFYPSLILSMLQVATESDTLLVKTDQNGVRSVRVGPHRIPTNSASQFIVNYSGPAHTFTYLSARNILNNTFDPALLKDAYVLVGTSAPGLFDLRSTPTDQIFPGVEIHAHALNTILSNNFLIRPEWAKGAEIVYLLVTGLLLILLLPWLKATKGALLALLLAGGMTAFSLWNFYYCHLLIDLLYPLFVTGLLFTVLTLLNYMAEENKASRIRSTFSLYLAPDLVEELVENQDSLTLGGEERDLTILFSDIRGFTSLSETMSAHDLCTFLNEYLTPMTSAVMDEHGTVDKFIGDAVMAFWNAPLPIDNHIFHGCKCAIKMMAALDELNISWAERGLPAIDIGIGIHTGVARVGNMGSSQRFDYTVMGDTVNLSSRLEGLNKMYGTNILVSNAVYTELQESDFAFRIVDTVRVKGKTEPATVYELLGWKNDNQSRTVELQAYDLAMAAYQRGEFQSATQLFTELTEKYPEDRLYDLYEERCTRLAASPPEQWEGITDMTSK